MPTEFETLHGPCVFPAAKPEANGYVRWRIKGTRNKKKVAHRVVWEEAFGPIPNGYCVDHECHNNDPNCLPGPCIHRSCINLDHLALKTSGQNVLDGKGRAAENARRESCVNEHVFTVENTYIFVLNGRPQRQCRMCKLLHHQRMYAERKAREWGFELNRWGTGGEL